MDKRSFLEALRAQLWQLGEQEREKSVGYYAELIEDMAEDGISEQEAIEKLGGPETVAEQVLSDLGVMIRVPEPAPTPEPAPAVQAPARKKGWTPAAITLAVIGFPVWLPILLSVGVVIFSLLLVMWVLVLTVFIVALALAVSAAAVLAAGIAGTVSLFERLMLFGGALVIAGLAILFFLAGIGAGKGAAALMTQMSNWFHSAAKKRKEA